MKFRLHRGISGGEGFSLKRALRTSLSYMLVILVWLAFFGMIAFAIGLAVMGARHGAAGHGFNK